MFLNTKGTISVNTNLYPITPSSTVNTTTKNTPIVDPHNRAWLFGAVFGSLYSDDSWITEIPPPTMSSCGGNLCSVYKKNIDRLNCHKINANCKLWEPVQMRLQLIFYSLLFFPFPFLPEFLFPRLSPLHQPPSSFMWVPFFRYTVRGQGKLSRWSSLSTLNPRTS